MKMGKVFKDCSSAMALLKECSEILKTWQTAYTHLGEGIKVVEFVYKQNDDKLFFVEAKSSSPKPSGAEFKKYIEDISKKFVHSFDLWLSMNLKRRQDDISEEIFRCSDKQPDISLYSRY